MRKLQRRQKFKEFIKRIKLTLRPPERMILNYLYRYRFDRENHPLNQKRFHNQEQYIRGLSDKEFLTILNELWMPNPKDKSNNILYFVCQITKQGVERVEAIRNNRERRNFGIINIILAGLIVVLTWANIQSNKRTNQLYDRVNKQIDLICEEIK